MLLRVENKKNHHSSRISQFAFISVFNLENIEVCAAKVHGKCGPADSRSPCSQHIWETYGSSFRSKMTSSSSTLPVTYRELQSLEDMFLSIFYLQLLGVVLVVRRISSYSDADLRLISNKFIIYLFSPKFEPRNGWFWYHSGRWTIWMFIKVKIDRVKLLVIFIFVKI